MHKQFNIIKPGMKIFIANIVLIFVALQVAGQQLMHHSQYMLNHFEINAAATGSTEDLPVSFSYKKLWAGIEGSPSLQSLSAHMALNDNMGTGIKIFNYTAGPERKTGLEGAYSYHLSLENIDSKLSFGISFRVYQYFLDKANMTVEDETDELFMGTEKMIVPDGSFGTYLYGKTYYVGLAIPQLIQRTINLKSDILEQRQVRHYFLHGGYKYQINSNFKIEPSVLMKFIEAGIFQADINALLTYQNMISFGLSYRTSDAVVFMIGYQYDRFRIGYAFDLTLSDIRTQSSGSHEVFISYSFDNFLK
jgi:type IX secretion system PorP/SprF family membrane protein